MRLSDEISAGDVGKYLGGIVSPAIHPGSLALFRLLYCGALFFFMWDFDQQFSYFAQDRLYHPVPTFSLLGLPILPELGVHLVYWGLMIGLALGGLGIGSRAPLFVAAFGYFYLKGLQMGFMRPPFTEYTYHSGNLAVFVLLIMAISPTYAHQNIIKAWKEPLSRVRSGWPVQLVKLSLAIAYFGAVYCRLTTSTKWLDGYTLQAYLLERFLLNGEPLALTLAQSIPLCIVLSWLAVLFEAFFFLALLVPRTALVLVPAGIAFHFGIWLAMDIQFFPFFVITYFAFAVDGREFWLRRKHPGLPRAAAAMRRVSRLIFAGVAAVLLTCVFARVEYWPFTDFGVFSHPSRWSALKAIRVGIQPPDGPFRWFEEGDFCFLKPNMFFARYRRANQTGAEWYLRRLLDEARNDGRPDKIPIGSVLTVFERKVRVAGSEIEVLDAPIAQFPVADNRSLCP